MEEARSKSILTGPACCKSVGMGRVTPGCLHLAGKSGTLWDVRIQSLPRHIDEFLTLYDRRNGKTLGVHERGASEE